MGFVSVESGLRVLYLDFDGVLHPDEVYSDAKGRVYLKGPGTLFEHAPVLAAMLDPYPEIRILLSTSWVRMKSYSWTPRRLPMPLQERVIGATWHSRNRFDGEAAAWWPMASRYEQICADVRRRAPVSWFALDDDLEGWPENDRGHLVECLPTQGLGDARTRQQLADRLEVWRHDLR